MNGRQLVALIDTSVTALLVRDRRLTQADLAQLRSEDARVRTVLKNQVQIKSRLKTMRSLQASARGARLQTELVADLLVIEDQCGEWQADWDMLLGVGVLRRLSPLVINIQQQEVTLGTQMWHLERAARARVKNTLERERGGELLPQFTPEIQQGDLEWRKLGALVDTRSSVSLISVKLVNCLMLTVEPLTISQRARLPRMLAGSAINAIETGKLSAYAQDDICMVEALIVDWQQINGGRLMTYDLLLGRDGLKALSGGEQVRLSLKKGGGRGGAGRN